MSNKKRMPVLPGDYRDYDMDPDLFKEYEDFILTVPSGTVSSEIRMNWLIIYEELCEIQTRRVKTKKYTKESYDFERNAGEYLEKIAKSLASCRFRPRKFNKFTIHRPERTINAPVYPDRIAEAWIVEKFIKPFVLPKVTENNMACQTGKGSRETMRRIKTALAQAYRKYGYDFWFFLYDMKGYYDNLSHLIISKLFQDLPKEGYRLNENIIDSFQCKADESYAKLADPYGHYGIPKGNLPSQWYGIMYLNELDHIFEEMDGCMFSIRYMDDGLCLFRTKEECIMAYSMTKDYLLQTKRGLILHPKKTVYAPIKRGFGFCGWHYDIKPSGKILTHILQDRKKEMEKKLLRMQEKYRNGKISIKEALDVENGILNYLKWGDTYHLRGYISKRYFFTHSTKDEIRKDPFIRF